MPDPRSAVSLEGIDGVYATFATDNSTIVYDATKINGCAGVELAVSLSADLTVQLTADGDSIIGKLVSVGSDNFATVMVGGFTTLPAGNAASITRGKRQVGALGAASARGYIRDVAQATALELAQNPVTALSVAGSDGRVVVSLS